MENGLKKDVPSPAESSSGMYVAEPEPEYEVDDFEEVVYVDNIAAGPPISQSEDLSEKLKIPRRFIKTAPEDYYAAHVQGESMTAAGIPDGSTVLIHRTDVPRSGAIQLVRHGGKSTLKRLREIEDGGWRLCYEDNTGRRIDIGPGEEYQVQGDFAAVLPEEYWRKI
jgi:repressor LexA